MLAEIMPEEHEMLGPDVGSVSDMLEWAQAIVVDSDDAYAMLYDLYCNARVEKNRIDAQRKKLTEPLRRRTKYINAAAKPVTDLLDQVIAITNEKANGYRALLEQKHGELLAEASIFGDGIYLPPAECPAMSGTMSVKTIRRFAVTNIDHVPAKYLRVDEDAVERDLKLGIGEIPGLRIFKETSTSLRTR